MSKHTERTLKLFREQGYTIDVIERFIRNPAHPGGGFRRDYLGFGDLLAFNSAETILVQSCGADFSAHKKTMLELPGVGDWLSPNRRVLLVGWRKLKLKRNSKAYRWKPRIAEFFSVENEVECLEQNFIKNEINF